MADELPAGQPEPEASASAPAGVNPDIEKIKADLKAELQAEMDKRVGGFQTVINQQRDELAQLKNATLSEEERDELVQDEKDNRIAELESQIAVAAVAAKYPAIGDVYLKLLNAQSEEEQAQILLNMVQAPAAPPVEPEAPAAVDSNNPAQTVGDIIGRLPDGTPLTGDTAWEMLRKMGPGPAAG
jgi:hypothetical protein